MRVIKFKTSKNESSHHKVAVFIFYYEEKLKLIDIKGYEPDGASKQKKILYL